jgi:ferredoxin, 2Fe-2S
MANLVVISRDGTEKVIPGQNGLSVMEIIRGCCSCATCHVHIDPASASNVAPMGEDENDLLDSSDHRDATSRLSCQIPFSDALDGLRVTIAQED